MADPVRIEGYRDFTRLGAGGFAIVYRAYQERFDRIVAVKVLNQTLDGRALRRFERECQATGRLSGHPNVVTVLDSGVTADGLAYMTTELMERGSLGDWIDQHGAMPLADVLQIGVKMCGALTDVHEAGILHRDLKPPNILVSKYGEPALADFGISAVGFADATGNTTSFTPQHTPPEVLEGQTPAVTMDVYSLGSTLYHLLNGAPAFDIGDDEALLPFIMRVLNEEVPPLGADVAPAEVSAVLARAMAKKAADRYQTAEDLGRALQELQVSLGHTVTPMAATGPDAMAGDGAAAAIPSLLLPTFQPTLSPTVTTPAPSSNRTGLVVAAAIVVVLALAGVGLAISRSGSDVNAGTGPGTTVERAAPLVNPNAPTPGGTLKVGVDAVPNAANPMRLALNQAGYAVGANVFEPLARQRGDGLDNILAESIEPNGAFTAWTIRLRPNITFHDGSPLDGVALKTVLDAYRTNIAAAELFKPIDDIAVTGERSVTISMSRAWAIFPTLLPQLLIVAPGSLTDDQRPAGTGPFAIAVPLSADGISLHRAPRYWRPKQPFVDDIEYRFYTQEQQMLAAFEAHEIDLMFTSALSTIQREQSRTAVVVQRHASINYLVLQTNKTPTDDLRVRQAIAYAIDRTELVAADGGLSVETQALMSPETRWAPKEPGVLPHDVAKAKAQIDEYQREHDRAGQPLEVHVTTLLNSEVARLFPLLKKQLQAAGISLVLNAVEATQFVGDLLQGNGMVALTSTVAAPDPDNNYVYFHSYATPSSLNLSHFNDPEIDAALDLGRSSADDAVRAEAIATVTRRLNAVVSYLPLSTDPFALVASTDVTGIDEGLAVNLIHGGANAWALALGIEH
jgi:ABC-type transport system substrate-binding protein